LGETEFDSIYGARPLKRVIPQQLENPLAQEILAGRFQPGETIEVDVEHGKFAFMTAATAEPVDRALRGFPGGGRSRAARQHCHSITR